MNKWHVAGASVTGASHLARGRSNDDAFAFAQQSRWSAIVVCDGAGSSSRAREGADIVAHNFLSELLSISKALDELGPGPWLNDAVIRSVLNVRASLAEISGTYDLTAFHCTLVAALVSNKGGFTVHIGDGVVIAGQPSPDGNFEVAIQSNPENGEYANETFFITESTWLKNIRIRPLRAISWIILATDGAGSVLMDRGLKKEAISNLFDNLAEGNRATDLPHIIENYLQSDYSKNCSADDKTLVIAFSESVSFAENLCTQVGSDQLLETQSDATLAAESVEPSARNHKKSRTITIGVTDKAHYMNRAKRIRLLQAAMVAVLSASILAAATMLILRFSSEIFPGEEVIQQKFAR